MTRRVFEMRHEQLVFCKEEYDLKNDFESANLFEYRLIYQIFLTFSIVLTCFFNGLTALLQTSSQNWKYLFDSWTFG